MCVKMFGVVIS